MLLLPLTLLISCILIPSSLGLHESDVGKVDWHKKLIGIPLWKSKPTAPVFHRVRTGGPDSKRTTSFIITATESNVLAAVDPVNSSISWRYVFREDDPVSSFHLNGNDGQ